MPKATILVVEDEEDILELIRYNLAREGYAVLPATTGEQALRLAKSERPDLILLDLMLPGMVGLEVCRALKREPHGESIPIAMLTAKNEEADVVAGLELGADDYIAKPFSPRVLVARVRTLRRRARRRAVVGEAPLSLQGVSIHPGRREVLVGEKPVDLTFTEFQLLHLLAARPGWVFTRNQIVEGMRGEDYPVTDRSVDVQVVALRKKLGHAGALIETVRGVGYRFRE
ncbi:MAG: response regulator transcription factor [bacterium]